MLPANKSTQLRYTVEVVIVADNVPMGMLLEASFRSPERFDPAMMPKRKIVETKSEHHDPQFLAFLYGLHLYCKMIK